jgi:hypothetical protein
MTPWMQVRLVPPKFGCIDLGRVQRHGPLRSDVPPEYGWKNCHCEVANALFWFIFLLFLPAILDALGMAGLVAPLQGMFDDVLA